jgi:hypothetical protein
MTTKSLFCEHKKLRSTCALCGASRVGPPPAKGPTQHDPDTTWRALRLETHARFRKMSEAARGKPWSPAFYERAFDKAERRGPKTSEEEDPATYRGAFYLTMVKLFDVTVEGRRIQGYNSLSDWDDMRDYVFRRIAPADFPAQVAAKKLQIHGGNAAWPRQQIASDLVRSARLQEAVELVAFGDDGVMPDAASEKEIARRLAALEKLAREEGIDAGTLSLGSKVLHVFAPARWPAHWTRTSREVGAELGLDLPEVTSPESYLAFATAVRAFAAARGDPDLIGADIAFNNMYEELNAEGDDEELPPLDE